MQKYNFSMKKMYVYIITNDRNGTLYIGVTNDLVRRIYEHKNCLAGGFSCKYKLDKLVYYEIYEDSENAIKREKTLKRYNRNWKKDLIESMNPEWKDLYNDICR